MGKNLLLNAIFIVLFVMLPFLGILKSLQAVMQTDLHQPAELLYANENQSGNTNASHSSGAMQIYKT